MSSQTQPSKPGEDPTPDITKPKLTLKGLAEMVASSDSLSELNVKLRKAALAEAE
ncbi:unnamed protein product [marine sediment metagenome]|uniref:Uncharacterized protein n=1 Tax=marine sediment metagenome TaxID=412755 RepID=X1CSF2_9ZZZZ